MSTDPTTPPRTRDELLWMSDFVWQRTWQRLDGLGDDEYLWQPAPGCWTIRPVQDGMWRADHSAWPPAPTPFTTLAWRIAHLIAIYGGDHGPKFRLTLPALGFDPREATPSAKEALARLEAAYTHWRRHLAECDPDVMHQQLGDALSQYAEATVLQFVLHEFDEHTHHGAELGVVRDLYRVLHEAVDTGDELLDRLVTGEARAGESGADPAAHPDIVFRAARLGRWDLVADLAEAGFSVNNDGTTALHLAVAGDDADAVEILIAHGADLEAKDDQYSVTPLVWAQFFKRDSLAVRLSRKSAGGR